MFEVGKKYKGVIKDIVWTCLYVDEGQIIMQASNTKAKIHFLVGQTHWQEYVEPKVVKRVFHVRTNKEDEVWFNREAYNKIVNAYDVGKIELTIIEDKLTNVEIVE